MKQYQYNGKYYDFDSYVLLISKKTGGKIAIIEDRIRKGWSIEKLMLPNNVKRPVYKYNLEGNFIKSYTSISQAVKDVGNTTNSSIRLSANKIVNKRGDNVTAAGFIWRYADEIKDTSEKLNVVRFLPYNYTENRKYLKKRYDFMIKNCYHKSGKWYGNSKIKVYEGWINNFEAFYEDMLPELEKAIQKYPSYKRRMTRGVKFKDASNKLNCNHIFFSRIDKTEGFLPFNISFTTPDWTMRYRSNSHRIVVDGKIEFIPEIYDNLSKESKNKISEAMIRDSVVNKKDIPVDRKTRKYFYKGIYYSRKEIIEMLHIPKNRLMNYLKKYGKYAVDKCLQFKEIIPTIIFNGRLYRMHEIINIIMNYGNHKLHKDTIRHRVLSLLKYKKELTDQDFSDIIKKPLQKVVYVENHNSVKTLSELCKENNLDYGVTYKRLKRGQRILNYKLK